MVLKYILKIMLLLGWFTNTQVVEGLWFQYNWHMEVVKLSALPPGHLYLFWYHLYSILLAANSTQGYGVDGRIMSVKNFNDAIVNRNRDSATDSPI
jgi:hypothetical protein